MARKKRTSIRATTGISLSKAINNMIDARLNKLFQKQNPRLKKTMSEIEKALKRIEKRMSRTRTAEKPGAVRKSRRGRKPSKPKTCTQRGCQRPARARGLCNSHYVMALRKGTIKTTKRRKKAKKSPKAKKAPK